MTADISSVVIVGGGVAAHRCAFRLRELGYERRITLVSREALAPYDRTALTKSMLTTSASSPPALSDASAYEAAEIQLELNATATRLLPGSSTVVCHTGQELRYDRAVIATGASPALPAALKADGVHTVREAADLTSLLGATSDVRRIAIIGGGLIGCELASSLSARGRSITLIEMSSGLLGEAVGSDVGARIADLHRAAGIEVLTSTAVQRVSRAATRQYQLALSNGEQRTADCVIVAVGVKPTTSWLADSGVTLDDGIVTDDRCHTSVPGVLAAGDCTVFPSGRHRRAVRMEHWDAASHHGAAAADNLLGIPRVFDPVPFFWSDQHGSKLSMAGVPGRGDRVVIEESPNGFVASFNGRERRTAVFGLNHTKDVVLFRRALETSSS